LRCAEPPCTDLVDRHGAKGRRPGATDKATQAKDRIRRMINRQGRQERQESQKGNQ
jgi:hypothetical protein